MIPPFQIHDLYSVLDPPNWGSCLVPCATWGASTTRPTSQCTKPYPSCIPLVSSQVNGSVCLNSTIRGEDCRPAITQNRTTSLSYPGREVTSSGIMPTGLWDRTTATLLRPLPRRAQVLPVDFAAQRYLRPAHQHFQQHWHDDIAK